jgi:hypothetical protein
MSQSHLSSPESAGLITRRSQVQILPPLLSKGPQTRAFCFLPGDVKGVKTAFTQAAAL